MSLNPLPLPSDTPMVEPNDEKALLITFPWLQALVTRDQQQALSSERVVDEAITAQAASIGATPLVVGESGGFFAVNIYARITRAATVSSSFQLTLAWTEGAQALTKVFTALTANTVTTYQAEVFPLRVDANTAFTYAVAYASVGATTMQYSLELVVQRIA